MAVSEQMSAADAASRLGEIVDLLERERGRVVITRHGRPAAVIMTTEDLEALEETLDIMADEGLLTSIWQSVAELRRGTAELMAKPDALRLAAGQ